MNWNATLRPVRVLLLMLTTFCLLQTVKAQPNLQYQPVISSGLSSPIDIVNAADGTNRLFVVQQGGTIRVYDQAFNYQGNLVTVSGISFVGGGDERGLLSMAFHPDYETNRFFYVYYTTTDGSDVTYINVARYQTRADNPNLADDSSRKVLISIPKPVNFTNHNGGRLQFGPDGMLYFATGDGGSGGDPLNNAQNGNSFLGKMIRLQVNTGSTAYVAPYYTIPADNPYVTNGAVRDEIFAMGLRNPFRWSFDRLTGDMWIGDVGQGAREEINFRAAGPPSPANYGWRCYEGNLPFNTGGCADQSTYVFPVFDYPNPAGPAAVTGGHVYRGSEYPTMYGIYIAADVYSATNYLIRPNGSGGWSVTSQTAGLPGNIVAFGEGEDASLYAVSIAGTVYEVITNTLVPIRLQNFYAIRRADHVEVAWKTAYEADLQNFDVEFSSDGRNFQLASQVSATNSGNGSVYAVKHFSSLTGIAYYRLKIRSLNGTIEYSPIVTTASDKNLNGASIPGIVRNNRLLITLYEPFTSLRVMTPLGQTMFTRNIEGMAGMNEITLPSLPAGAYVVQLVGRDRQFSGRIVVTR
jgi:glucose/arabinose dehydrogenase